MEGDINAEKSHLIKRRTGAKHVQSLEQSEDATPRGKCQLLNWLSNYLTEITASNVLLFSVTNHNGGCHQSVSYIGTSAQRFVLKARSHLCQMTYRSATRKYLCIASNSKTMLVENQSVPNVSLNQWTTFDKNEDNGDIIRAIMVASGKVTTKTSLSRRLS